ncbi:hypothetical protein B0T25DRAFT_135301 [Lasiosphaeria hispida]|uniref:F-box domain-containing protein n=1 Tax=Lasiosphaeria hispida TaxID=260671 RepID=A0AAJ0HKE6_9PEZI|nr:hypothetical protein B0T25DRAFT_135301 [Lasiosphaeria hispida]
MGTRPRSERQQLLFDLLTSLLPSRGAFRRWWDGHLAPATSPVTNDAALSESFGIPQPPPKTSWATQDAPDADAPVALLLPGMAQLTVGTTQHVDTAPLAAYSTPTASRSQAFAHKPPRQPDLFLAMLPPDIHFAVFEAAELSLNDLLALRRTCRTLRRNLPVSIMERKLKLQNYAGWEVVFEMHGHRYPGTTYGNRRLCGRCVVPKIRGHLIDGAVVRAYLARRRAAERGEGWSENDEEWPEERAMCFSCLYTVLHSMVTQQKSAAPPAVKVPVGAGIYKMAAISTKERFLMVDGTTRKMCDRCARDIHENAVPCPHCTNFSEWCKTRHA